SRPALGQRAGLPRARPGRAGRRLVRRDRAGQVPVPPADRAREVARQAARGSALRPGPAPSRAARLPARSDAAHLVAPRRTATRLHTAMLRPAAACGHAGGWPAATLQTVGPAIEFLVGPTRSAVAAMLDGGARIPEEVLGPGELRAALAD